MSEGWTYRLDFQGQAIDLAEGESTIGRSRRADISINDPSVSRVHAKLHAGEGMVKVEDLDSSNGTFVNGLRIADPVPARQGSTLGLGDAELTVHIEALAFRTVRMSAADLGQVPAIPKIGEATSMLQAGSVELAQQVIDQGNTAASSEPVTQGGEPLDLSETPASLPTIEPLPATPSFAAPPVEAPAAPAVPPMAPPSPPLPSGPTAAPVTAPPPAPPSFEDPAPPSASFASPAPSAAYPQSFGEAPPPPPPVPALEPEPATAGSLGTPLADPDQSQVLRTFDEIEAGISDPEVENAPAVVTVPPVAVGPPSSLPAPAGFGIRLAAALIDGLWLTLLNVVVIFGWTMIDSNIANPTLVPALMGCFIALAVFVVGWATVGTTPGKRLLGLYVCTLDGQAGVGFGRALLRYFGYMISAAVFFIGFLMIAFSSTKRGLHDLIAGTYVARRS